MNNEINCIYFIEFNLGSYSGMKLFDIVLKFKNNNSILITKFCGLVHPNHWFFSDQLIE